jgi:predicted dehydrogenase
MTRPTRTRVAITGAGIIANRHMGNLLGFDDVDVVAVADPLADRARTLAARSGARVYADCEAMLDRERPDAMYICVPPYAHGGPEHAAIQRCIPFFTEKPIARDLETAEVIARGVASGELVTATGYHWRYLDIVERVQDLLATNAPRLVLGYWLDFTPPPEWWTDEARSGGQMVEQTTHIFDLARYLVGEVSSVYAVAGRTARIEHPSSNISDVSTATLQFASGAVGNIASTCLLGWPHRIGLHLFCDRLAIELSEFELMVDVGKGRPVEAAVGDPFVREDRDFIDAVQGKPNRIRAPYAEALKTHRLATAAARSAREGRLLSVVSEPALI